MFKKKLGKKSIKNVAEEGAVRFESEPPSEDILHPETFKEEHEQPSDDGSAGSYDDSDEDPWYVKVLNRLEKINENNDQFNTLQPGIWDEWGVYYCSHKYGRHSRFKPYQFALAGILIIGQNNFMDFLFLLHENGGIAFFVVLFIVYFAFGYPMLLLETIVGQYAGRKPTTLARFLSPAFSGLGVALYIRTLTRALNSVAHFAISLYIGWDCLFCKGAQSVFLRQAAVQEARYHRFNVFKGLKYPYFTGSEGDLVLDKWVICASSLVFLMSLKRIREIGGAVKVVIRIFYILLIAYTASGYIRSAPSLLDGQTIKVSKKSMVYLPITLAFTPDWWKLLDGNAWVKAMSFVLNSLELGTLAHPYLGSKQFFHYRAHRDGVILILASIFWNLTGITGILLWFGYIGISRKEIQNAFQEFEGHHGLFIVFIMKYLQAEMTQQVEADILFFAALFYLIVGTTALLTSIVYLYVVIDCSYPESGHPTLKLTIMAIYLFFFIFILFPGMISENGIRHMMVLDFYGSRSWVALLLSFCYCFTIVWSYEVPRLLHDFFNIVHLKGYESKRTYAFRGPKILAWVFLTFLFLAMIVQMAENATVNEGPTDWSDTPTQIVGNVLMLLPVIAIVVGFIHFLITREKGAPFMVPHRDFFKNKHHVAVCFKSDELDLTVRQRPRSRRSMGKSERNDDDDISF